MTRTLTTPRPYSSEWRDSEPQTIQTRYGPVLIQALGWGIRVESLRDDVLRVNGGPVRVTWADFHERNGAWTCDNFQTSNTQGYGFDAATPKQREKLAAEIPPLVNTWARENAAEVEKRRQAYVYDRARTCEESIRELEEALADYRKRLRMIERGDMEISPYLNGGKGIST